MLESLIYDWNKIGAPAKPPLVMLDDETLRDGLQSPSVRTPTIAEKIAILHLIDKLGIDTADIGLPGAGPHVVVDVERLAREIVDAKLKVRANCAARTTIADITPVAEISQRTGLPLEVGMFIGSSPIRQYTEGWSIEWLLKTTEDAIKFAVKEGLQVMYVTEDTTRSDPATLRRLYECAIRAGAHRICLADTVGHATPWGASAVVRFAMQVIKDSGADVGLDWHGHRDRDLAIINSIAALDAGATRIHAAALGIGERVGNTPMDLLLVNLVVMGFIDRDLSPLMDYVETVSARHRRADSRQLSGGRQGRVPHRHRRACRGGRQGVEEGRSRPDGRGLFRDSREPRRPPPGDRGRADVREVERRVLAGTPRHPVQRSDRRSGVCESEELDDGADRSGDPGRSVPVTNIHGSTRKSRRTSL